MQQIVTIGNKAVILELGDLPEVMEIETLLNIDYSQILFETLTFSVLLNRIGILEAELEKAVKKMDFNVKALKEDLDNTLGKLSIKYVSKLKSEGITSPTVAMTTAKAVEDSEYKEMYEKWKMAKMDLIDAETNHKKVVSLYWAAKSKDEKLNKISDKIRAEDYLGEVDEVIINGIRAKVRKYESGF